MKLYPYLAAYTKTNSKWIRDLNLQAKTMISGTSLVAQWLRLHAPNVGGPGLIPGLGTESHILQLKIQHAATENQCAKINKLNIKK